MEKTFHDSAAANGLLEDPGANGRRLLVGNRTHFAESRQVADGDDQEHVSPLGLLRSTCTSHNMHRIASVEEEGR